MKSNLKLLRLFFLSTFLLSVFCKQENSVTLFYSIDVRINPSSNQIHGMARIQNPPDSCFYLNKNFQITKITANEQPLPFHRIDSEYLPYTVGTAIVIDGDYPNNLSIEYTGAIDHVINNVNTIQADLVELALYAAWYPLFRSAGNFEFEMNVDLPSGYVTTTNGVLDHQQEVDGRCSSHWNAFDACSDIVLIASPHFKKLEDDQTGNKIEIFFNKAPIEHMTAKKENLTKAMIRFSDFYGPLQTQGLIRYVNAPRSGWGYSRAPLFVVSEEYTLRLLGQEFGQVRDFHGSVHELAHFWWLIADAATPDDWINEGLAEYSAFRLSEAFFGQTFADVLVAGYREHAAQSNTETSIAETTDSSDDRYVNRYEKMALIFIEARRRFGQEKLDRVFKALYSKFAGTNKATTEQFLKEVENQLGSEARTFFYNALYQTEWMDPAKRP